MINFLSFSDLRKAGGFFERQVEEFSEVASGELSDNLSLALPLQILPDLL